MPDFFMMIIEQLPFRIHNEGHVIAKLLVSAREEHVQLGLCLT